MSEQPIADTFVTWHGFLTARMLERQQMADSMGAPSASLEALRFTSDVRIKAAYALGWAEAALAAGRADLAEKQLAWFRDACRHMTDHPDHPDRKA
jgi:hypothetical protein